MVLNLPVILNYMKIKTILLLCLISIFQVSAKKTYDLKWNIAPNEEVVYNYAMKYISDTLSIPQESNNPLVSKDIFDVLKEMLAKHAQDMEKATWKLSYACNKHGIIDVLLKYENKEPVDYVGLLKDLTSAFSKNKDSLSKADAEFMRYLETGDSTNLDENAKSEIKRVQEIAKLIEKEQKDKQGKPTVALRGSVYENGDIYSFWTKQDQLNLLAIMAQLPSQKVAVGDSWSIQTKLINCDQNIIYKDGHRKNKVTLEKVEVVDGESIAVINYDIVESFSGEFDFDNVAFKNPFIGDDKYIGFEAKVTGKGYFSVTKGRWKKFASYISITKKNSTNSNTTTQLITFEQ